MTRQRALVIVAALGSSGDVHPLAALACTLQARGHEVVLLSNEHFAPLAAKLGLRFVAVGTREQYEAALADPNFWHPRKSVRLVWEMVGIGNRTVYAAIEALAEPGRTILVGSTLALGMRLAQEKLKLPMATVHLSPCCFLSAERPPTIKGLWLPQSMPLPLRQSLLWLVERTLMDGVCAPDLNRQRAELGLPPVRHVVRRWLHSPDLVLGLFPEWFCTPQRDWPAHTHLTGFALFDEAPLWQPPAAMQAFLAAGSAPIVFTPGSAMTHAQHFFRNAIEACAALGRRGLLLTPYTQQLPATLPAFMHHENYVPLSQVLPHAAALVYHGGIGTCSQALAAGVPQLVTPYAHDQFDNAARVQELGVGLQCSPTARAEQWIGALRRLLEPGATAEACARVRGQFQGGADAGLLRACELIERLG